MKIKRKSLFIIAFVLILALCVPAIGTFADGDNLAKNGDFEKLDSNGLPKNWEFTAYYDDGKASNYSVDQDAERGNVVKITNNTENDARFIQKISVKGGKTYKFSCYVKTENVAGGAGANIGFENVTEKSKGITGTSGWTYIEIIGKTDDKQKEISVGVRLGGFGATSTGTAWFDDFRVEEVEDTGTAVKLFTSGSSNENSNNGSSGTMSASEFNEVTARSRMAVIMLAVFIIAPVAIYFLLGFEHKKDKASGNPYPKTPAQLAPSVFDTKPLLPKKTDTKLRYTKKDWIFVVALTVVYGVIAVLNLGSLKATESYWQGNVGAKATVYFDSPTLVNRMTQNSGISNESSYSVTADNGSTFSYTVKYGVMYRWSQLTGAGNSTVKPFGQQPVSSVTIEVTKGTVVLNEIAFFDEEGNVIPVHAEDDNSALLVDEQDSASEYRTAMSGMYFDELYHARTAYEGLHDMSIYEWTHPPLGKQIIGIGISIFGMSPFGWRIMGTLFGIAMIPVMYAFGKRMFGGRSELALLAAGLLAFDFMHFSQTRIATVDTYGVFFNLCMTYYMYKFLKMDLGDDLKSTLLPLALSGIFFGIGCASKWICIYTGAALAVMFFTKLIVLGIKAHKINAKAAEKGYSKAELEEPAVKNSAKFAKRALLTCLWCVLFFIIVPVTIYTASYGPYWRGEWKAKAIQTKVNQLHSTGQLAPGETAGEEVLTFSDKAKAYINGVIKNQKDMYNYHSGLDSTHAYQSSWYEWPLSNRPMWFYLGQDADSTKAGTISSFGNPAVWWACFIGTVTLLLMFLRGRFRLNTDIFFIFVSMASAILPWMLISRCVFIYHYFATVPFIILASVYVLKHYEDKYYYYELEPGQLLPERKKGVLAVKWVWLGLAIVLFGVFYPVISGLHVSRSYISALQLLPTWTFLGSWPAIFN